jgi:hypothetical protein
MAEIRNLIAEFAIGLQELNKNKILCGRGIWDETKSFLQNKAGISAIKERKNSCELDFSISNKIPAPSTNFVPRGKTVTAAYLHKALANI